MIIDVSHYQSIISWPLVKLDGVDKCYIKAAEGNTFVDSRFRSNWQNARLAGVQRGSYHFFRANVSPLNQARHFVNTVGVDLGELPLALDVETNDGIGTFQLTTNVRACLFEIERLVGRKPIIYSSKTRWNALTTRPTWVVEYSWWLAQYSSLVSSPALPANVTTWWLWQYTSSGRVRGISGDVDLNRENTDMGDPILTPQQMRIAGHAEAIIAEVA